MSQALKIAQIVCVYPPYKGGMGESAYEISARLAQRGCDVTVFTPAYDDVVQENLAKLKIFRLKPWLKAGNGAFIPQLLFKLKDFDIVHLHYPFFGGAEIIWLAKRLGASWKLVIHYHMDVKFVSWKLKLLSYPSSFIFSDLIRMADKIIFSSLDYAVNSEYKKLFHKYQNKLHEIPFAVDTDRFFPIQKSPDEIINLLFVGALDKAHYFKGLHILLKACKKFKHDNWHLSIVGGGDMLDDYKKIVFDLSLEDKIIFLGRVADADLASCYQTADLLILPSTEANEAFGIVLLEAMSCGVAVLASNLPGVRTVFTQGKHGDFVRPGDEDDLYNKLNYYLEHKQDLLSMGLNGRKLVEEKYFWEKIIDKFLFLYK